MAAMLRAATARAGSRMSDTRVRRVPAVARYGRGVLVALERCERPVHVRTRAVAARRSGERTPTRRDVVSWGRR